MTIVPMMKRCPVCHKRYSWNPDVGQFRCPYCGGNGEAKKDILRGLIEKLKKGQVNKEKKDTL